MKSGVSQTVSVMLLSWSVSKVKGRGDVLVTVPVQVSVWFLISPFSLSVFVSSSVNITEFCLPVNSAWNECV